MKSLFAMTEVRKRRLRT